MTAAEIPYRPGEDIVLRLRLEPTPAPASEPAAGPRLYRSQEVADRLGVGLAKVTALIATGELPSVKLGGSRRISHRQLIGYIARLETEAAGSQ